MKNRKSVIALLLVSIVGIVGLTIAYFSNQTTIENEFNTNPYGTTITEEFVSPDNWLPGTSTDKSLTVTNTGQVDEAVRISYTESWTSKSAKNNDEEGDLPLSQNGNTAALIHFTNTDDWTTSTLKDFLNENYYLSSEEELTYGLRLSVRNMIEDSIFYLGGIDYQNYNGANYGDTIEIYKWERGTDVFNQDIHYYDICNGYLSTNFCKARMISWSGKIALLYPSDVYMTYSNNVDNICYNNPNDCNRFYYDWDNVNNISILKEKQNPGSPEKSWIYNSNIRDGQSMISDIWLLSSASSNAETSFYISNLGKLGPANWMSGVRPTLYLSSSVKIIDGDGSINNPYKLSL